MLGDRNQQGVKEEHLVLGRLLASEQQMEEVGEADVTDQLARQIAPADLDAIGMGLADVADRTLLVADLHGVDSIRCAPR